MTALAQDRMKMMERWTYRQFSLASGNLAYKNGICCADLSTGKVEPGHAEADLLYIGTFAEQVDATSVEKLVNVNLGQEIEIEWFANSGTFPVLAANTFGLCFIEDDQTVSLAAAGRAVAGRIWGVDSLKGVAVQKLQTQGSGVPLTVTAAPAYVANDLIIPASPASGTVYDVPTTAAASTVTLPDTADSGTVLYFKADGTKNGHTVQYRQATGPTNLSTALTASKRHLVIAVFQGTTWAVNAYVAP